MENTSAVRDAAARVLRCYQRAADRGENLCSGLFGGEEAIEAYRPYGLVFDATTGAKYFYHAHPASPVSERIRGEHGHFHLFIRPAPRAPGEPRLVQLISISVDPR